MQPASGNPRAEAESVASFYHLDGVALDAPLACSGLACFAARNDDPACWQAAQREPRVHCLGQCDRAPASTALLRPDKLHRIVRNRARVPVLLERILAGGARDIDTYRRLGGGVALAAALARPPQEVLRMIEASQLRGRGGAGFPTGRKWAAVAAQPGGEKYVVANADEGDPGAYSDRVLLEDDPFRLIEGMRIAAHAVGADGGYIYLRKEYPRAAAVLQAALAQARKQRWLGLGFDIALVVGHGSYLAGEETAMMNAIEGRRPQTRQQPPRVSQRGLFGRPTLVNNVETLCAVPWILEHGAQAYAELGFSQTRGTKLLSLNSLFRHPGVYEVEPGISLHEIVYGLGDGLRRGRLRALMIGGPLAGLLPPSALDLRLGFEELAAAGAALGHGGVLAFADDSSIVEIAAEVFRFGAYESCGRCVACRGGSQEVAAMLALAVAGTPIDRHRWCDRIDAIAALSACGHGRGLGEFAQSLERHFAQELSACFA